MIGFYILVFLVFGILQLFVCIYEDIREIPLNSSNNDNYRFFYNTPEENERIDKLNRRRSFYRALRSDVAIALLVLLLYWLWL